MEFHKIWAGLHLGYFGRPLTIFHKNTYKVLIMISPFSDFRQFSAQIGDFLEKNKQM
jgi:hypothetical protein